MGKAFRHWKVLEHGPLEKLAENLWRVEASIPGMALKRQMVVMRFEDGRLLFHNPVALEEPLMAEIEAWGTPTYIVAPNRFHRLDTPIFKQRYPEAQVVCPSGSRQKIEEVAKVEATYEDVPWSDTIRARYVEGLNNAEGVFQVDSEDGVTLVFNDLLFNVRDHLPGFSGLVMRVLGSSGGPKVTAIAKLVAVKDKAAVRRELEALSRTENLVRVIPGHGDVITEQPGSVLAEVAAKL